MPPRKKRAGPGTVGLAAAEVAGGAAPKEVAELRAAVESQGGAVLAEYREPYAGQWVVMAALPIDRVRATPFQRELSKTHAERLARVIPKVGRFLDPIIAVEEAGGFWTPNGMHRLEAMRALGAKSVVALVIPDPKVAYRILALNTEKGHNLKDKSLEVVRMARALAKTPDGATKPESDWAFEFEEPAYLTVGACYEARPRFSGGAYLPVVKRCDEFSSEPLAKSLAERDKRAKKLLALDDAVNGAVESLKTAGFKSAYLKPFIVARINPLRFVQAAKPGQKAPRAEFDATVAKMTESAKKFDAKKVRPQDIAAMAAASAVAGAAAEE